MYKSIFEALYYGKINPFGRKVPSTPEKDQTEQKIQSVKEYFRNELSPENYQRLEELESLYTEASDYENLDLFAYGFTIGALIMAEVFNGREGIVNG